MDDLHKPLRPRGFLRRLWDRRPTPAQTAWGLVLAAVIGGGLWAYLAPLPEGAEPKASAAIREIRPKADPTVTASISTRTETRPDGSQVISVEGGDDGDAPPPDDVGIDARDLPSSPEEAAASPVTGMSGEGGKRRLAMLGLPRGGGLPRAPLRDVSEKSRYGRLPKVAGNGRRPWEVYARPVTKEVLSTPKPKIAIVLDGVGLNARTTKQAISDLPGEVTLAFAALADNLQKQINRARAAGHEVMLQVPMEPWGWPNVNTGPQTLLVAARPEENRVRLLRQLGRAGGYIGIVNYTGQKFLAEGAALAPVLHELKRRGLVFLDDGATGRSMAMSLAEVIDLPALKADVRFDLERKPEAIAAALASLEQLARRRGRAIGIGTAFGVTVTTLDRWLATAMAGDQVQIVPLSALYRLQGRR